MITYLPAIFSFIVGAAGWFYMFYSTAAIKLAAVESMETNALRVRLRRVGGLAMMSLAVAFYAGVAAIEQERPSLAAGWLLAVLLLMSAVVVLGLVDLRLTHRIRQSERNQDIHEQ